MFAKHWFKDVPVLCPGGLKKTIKEISQFFKNGCCAVRGTKVILPALTRPTHFWRPPNVGLESLEVALLCWQCLPV